MRNTTQSVTEQSNASALTMKCGKNKKAEVVISIFRHLGAVEAVRKISHRKDFAFACLCRVGGNPDTQPDLGGTENYRGSFIFLWYNTSDRLHGTYISYKGNVVKDVARA